MCKYFIIFISLFATVIGAECQTATQFSSHRSLADSLYAQGQWAMAAIEYERCVMKSSSRTDVANALRQKALCYKQDERYAEAATTLARCAETQDDYFQMALNNYLADHYDKAAEVCSEALLLFDTSSDMLMLLTLSLNELQQYDRAKECALALASRMGNDEFSKVVDSLYKSTPKLKNEQLAEWLSLLPGLGHLYAGYPGAAITAMIINAAALGFGVWQVIERCYITAYIGGAGLLSATWPGAMHSARYHAQKRNYLSSQKFNTHCKERLLTSSAF